MTRPENDKRAPRKKRGRWNRVILSILGLGVGVGGVMAGTHLYGQHYVKSRIVQAFEQAGRTGTIKYGDIEVSGFIVPDNGVARDIEIYVPSLGMRVELPQVQVDPRTFADGSVKFSLPDLLDVQLTDENGVPTGRVLKVSGEELQATINSEGEEVYEFGVTSAETRVEEEVNGTPTGGYYDFKELDAQGRIVVDRDAASVVASGTFDASAMMYSAPPAVSGGEPEPRFEATDVTGTSSLEASGASISFQAGSMRGLGDASAESVAERLSLTISVTPKAGSNFDLAPLAEFRTIDEFGQTLGLVLADAIATGGVFDQDFAVGSIKVAATKFACARVRLAHL